MPVHPILLPRGYTAMTGPLTDYIDELIYVLSGNEPSMACVAPHRTGKTVAVRHLQARLEEKQTAVYIGMDCFRRRSPGRGNTERSFWRKLMGDLGDVDPQLFMHDPYTALVASIRTQCDRRGTPTVVFALDEAQNLLMEQLDMLKELVEHLIDYKLKPFVLLMGQQQLHLLVEMLNLSDRGDLVDRFMLSQYKFRGMTERDVEPFLNHLDVAVWPEGSGITYTQHFAPGLWQRGWRMGRQSELLWSTLVAEARKSKSPALPLEVGTKFVATAAHNVLIALKKEPHIAVSHQLFQEAVSASGFDKFLKAQLAVKAEVGVNLLDPKRVKAWYNAGRAV